MCYLDESSGVHTPTSAMERESEERREGRGVVASSRFGFRMCAVCGIACVRACCVCGRITHTHAHAASGHASELYQREMRVASTGHGARECGERSPETGAG